MATHKPQVYIDLSGWSPKYFPPILVQYANTLLKDKILFGSDYPVITPGEVDRGVRQAADQARGAAADHERERGAAFEALNAACPSHRKSAKASFRSRSIPARSSRRRASSSSTSRRLPIVHHHVAAMPDVHLGIGATVGSVIPTQTGDHSGGGRRRHRLRHDGGAHFRSRRTISTRQSLKSVFDQITPRRAGRASASTRTATRARMRQSRSSGDLSSILDKHPGIEKRIGSKSNWAHQLGTLGGGNHFIEVCLDEVGPRVGDAAFGQPRHRQRHRHVFHRAGEEGCRSATSRSCRTATSPISRKARSTSTTTSRRSAGRRTTRAPTARR